MCQQLQRIERWINLHLRIRQTLPYSIRKTKEQRVTRCKDNDFRMRLVTGKDRIQGNGYIYPFSIIRKNGGHNFMMTLSTGKDLTLTNDLGCFG